VTETESPGADKAASSWKSWPQFLAFLRPSNPQEAFALAALCVLLAGVGGAAVKAIEAVGAPDPWNVRADHICLTKGNEFISVEGNQVQELRARVDLTEAALSELRDVGDSVPIESTLAYQSMLSNKRDVLKLIQRKLEFAEAGKPTGAIENQIQGLLVGVYGPAAERLGLYVCGQGTGDQ